MAPKADPPNDAPPTSTPDVSMMDAEEYERYCETLWEDLYKDEGESLYSSEPNKRVDMGSRSLTPRAEGPHKEEATHTVLSEVNRRGDMASLTAHAEDPHPMKQEEAFSFSEPDMRGDMGTHTSHAENALAMEVSYNTPRASYLDPQYTAATLAPDLDILASHHTPSHNDGRDQDSLKVQIPNKTLPPPNPPRPDGSININPTTLMNPFALSTPTALAAWHEARTALARPSYFYTTMHRYGSIDGVVKGEEAQEEEERFPVRVRELTLEVEQGLADLRLLLSECHRVENEGALLALRDRIKTALEFS